MWRKGLCSEVALMKPGNEPQRRLTKKALHPTADTPKIPGASAWHSLSLPGGGTDTWARQQRHLSNSCHSLKPTAECESGCSSGHSEGKVVVLRAQAGCEWFSAEVNLPWPLTTVTRAVPSTHLFTAKLKLEIDLFFNRVCTTTDQLDLILKFKSTCVRK